MKITVVLESQREGGYAAYIPALPGCISQGETLKEAMRNIKRALKGYLAVMNMRAEKQARKSRRNTIRRIII